ncbi:DUF4595 domain-containing protein [Pedobacter sp. HMF7647]|uniref:DUF4595 domain-containing protein n=1 Tax=Hufsiella arboris TaxID=2695275 RepID=A0A7K1Y8F3_9SPHI|nr:DUF4595 domain-containing protein [Hufsiella arboris]MXV50700.1 DUF4595 domain-containing protein [Hufsiella arboris]
MTINYYRFILSAFVFAAFCSCKKNDTPVEAENKTKTTCRIEAMSDSLEARRFTYDDKGRITKVTYEKASLQFDTYSYSDNQIVLNQYTYPGDTPDTYTITRDAQGRILEYDDDWYNHEGKMIFTYNEDGYIKKIVQKDYMGQVLHEYVLSYKSGNLDRVDEESSSSFGTEFLFSYTNDEMVDLAGYLNPISVLLDKDSSQDFDLEPLIPFLGKQSKNLLKKIERKPKQFSWELPFSRSYVYVKDSDGFITSVKVTHNIFENFPSYETYKFLYLCK